MKQMCNNGYLTRHSWKIPPPHSLEGCPLKFGWTMHISISTTKTKFRDCTNFVPCWDYYNDTARNYGDSKKGCWYEVSWDRDTGHSGFDTLAGDVSQMRRPAGALHPFITIIAHINSQVIRSLTALHHCSPNLCHFSLVLMFQMIVAWFRHSLYPSSHYTSMIIAYTIYNSFAQFSYVIIFFLMFHCIIIQSTTI